MKDKVLESVIKQFRERSEEALENKYVSLNPDINIFHLIPFLSVINPTSLDRRSFVYSCTIRSPF